MLRAIKGNLPDFQERVLMALYLVSKQCADAMPGGVGELYIPGRSITVVLGGAWSTYRHKQMMLLVEGGWAKAVLGYERGSNLKLVWRYSLTNPAKVTLDERMSQAAKDCIWDYDIRQAELF